MHEELVISEISGEEGQGGDWVRVEQWDPLFRAEPGGLFLGGMVLWKPTEGEGPQGPWVLRRCQSDPERSVNLARQELSGRVVGGDSPEVAALSLEGTV